MNRSARTDSPCIDVCRMHAGSGWCEGCARTLDEIAAWGALDADRRMRILEQLPARQAALQPLLMRERTAAEGP